MPSAGTRHLTPRLSLSLYPHPHPMELERRRFEARVGTSLVRLTLAPLSLS